MLRAIEQAIRLTPVFLPLVGAERTQANGSYFAPALVNVAGSEQKSIADSDLSSGTSDLRNNLPAFVRTLSLNELILADSNLLKTSQSLKPQSSDPDSNLIQSARAYSPQEILTTELPELASLFLERPFSSQIETECIKEASSFTALKNLFGSLQEVIQFRNLPDALAPAQLPNGMSRQFSPKKASNEPPIRYPLYRERAQLKRPAASGSKLPSSAKSILARLLAIRI